MHVLALAQASQQNSPRYHNSLTLCGYKLIAQLRQVKAMRSACFSAQRKPFKAHANACVRCTPQCTASAVARDAAYSRREALKVRDSGGVCMIEWLDYTVVQPTEEQLTTQTALWSRSVPLGWLDAACQV